MSKKHDHNPHLIHDVTEVLVVQSKTLPPRTFVIATGENRTHATNPRLRRSAEPHAPELLLLDFEVDHGAATVLTGAQVVLEIELNGGQREVMVQARANSITVGLPEAEGAFPPGVNRVDNAYTRSYLVGRKVGGNTGTWSDSGALVIGKDGSVTLDGTAIKNPTLTATSLTWSTRDGNSSDAAVTLATASTSTYHWPNALPKGFNFTGSITPSGSGAEDFRGLGQTLTQTKTAFDGAPLSAMVPGDTVQFRVDGRTTAGTITDVNGLFGAPNSTFVPGESCNKTIPAGATANDYQFSAPTESAAGGGGPIGTMTGTIKVGTGPRL
jgi:hypothetical protein